MADLVSLAQEALLLSVMLSLPVVALSAIVSFFVGVFQAMTQVHDSTLGHLPRLVVAAVTLALTAPWMSSELVAFAARAFGGG